MGYGSLIALDPGKNTGIALFRDGKLHWCSLADGERLKPIRDDEAFVVCEFPFVYPGGRGKGDGNSLLSVAKIAGRLTALVPEDRLKFVYPRSWKGTVDKDVMCKRILDRLSDQEKRCLPKLPKSKMHNVIDAIGIGLHELGRL